MKEKVITSDIILASTLVASSYALGDLRVDSIGTGTFSFDAVDSEFLLSYERGSTCIEPKTFNQTVVKLTRMCRARFKSGPHE